MFDTSRIFFFSCILSVAVAMLGCGGNVANTQSNSSGIVPNTDSERRVGKTAVWTYHNDNQRSGWNQAETALTPANVKPETFGKIASFPVQGHVYAQPLYAPNVYLGSGRRANLLIVATEHDQLYAFDVDSKRVVWHVDYLDAGDNVSTLSQDDVFGCKDLVPEIGITGTPVIDVEAQVLYVVVRTKEIEDGETVFYQRLHAVGLGNGSDVMPAKIITGPPPSYASTGVAHFDPLLNNQRAALLLAHGQVYVAWASHCDTGDFMGWLISYDKTTLNPTAYWTPVPYSNWGGIWMSGGGPSVDASGDIYVPVANGGDHDLIGPKDNFRSSLVRLRWSLSDGFQVLDYFAPSNYQYQDDYDVDFGSSQALLLPDQPNGLHPHLLVVTDKSGLIYSLDRDNLGKWQPDDNSNAVQTFPTEGNGLASPLFWNSTLYYAGGRGYLSAYEYDDRNQRFEPNPKAYFNYVLDSRGSTPSLSANGTSDAILWMVTDFADGKRAVLHAFSPANIAVELYSSAMLPERDAPGPGVKFTVPTIADGMVFVGSQNQVDIYGLLQK